MLEHSLQNPNYEIYLAELDGEVVRFVDIRVFPDYVEGSPIAIIQNLIVEKEHRGKGIGSKLVERGSQEEKKRNTLEIPALLLIRTIGSFDRPLVDQHGL